MAAPGKPGRAGNEDAAGSSQTGIGTEQNAPPPPEHLADIALAAGGMLSSHPKYTAVWGLSGRSWCREILVGQRPKPPCALHAKTLHWGMLAFSTGLEGPG